MKTFDRMAAQGDLLIRRVVDIPVGLETAKTENGNYIVAHSETGHNHVIAARPSVTVYNTDDSMVSYLRVVEASDATETIIEHMRSFDTHESIVVSPGLYQIRRQREYIPEGFRRVAD